VIAAINGILPARNYTPPNILTIVITEDVHFCTQLAKKPGRPKNENWSLANVIEMSNIEHFPRGTTLHYAVMKAKELTPKQILSVPCTTCGAAIGKVCELHTGAPRTEPHRDRKLSAAQAVETKTEKQ
jgi:hypothetical protein